MATARQSQTEKPDARSDFARRLRELRVPRGFRTARSLARALEIDENRYTRYERAEVEPDLAMIRRICEILNITPSELLCGTPEEVARQDAAMNGSAHSSAGANDAHAKANGFAVPQRAAADLGVDLGLATTAWALAEAVIGLRRMSSSGANGGSIAATNGSASPLADVGATGVLYRSVMQQPFEAISALLEEPAVAGASPVAAQQLRRRIDDLLLHLRETGRG